MNNARTDRPTKVNVVLEFLRQFASGLFFKIKKKNRKDFTNKDYLPLHETKGLHDILKGRLFFFFFFF